MAPQTPTEQTGTLGPGGEIDPARGVVIVCCGGKGTGKTVMALTLTRAYPGDRLIIDVAGDDGPVGEEILELRGTWEEIPEKWPEWRRDGDLPMTIRYVPDLGSKTFLADCDAAIGMAVDRGECLVVVHEMGRVFPSGKTMPNASRLLQHGRHHDRGAGATTLIATGPRLLGIDKHLLAQADRVYVFDLQSKSDRDEVREGINWDRREFDDAVSALRQHEHLVYDRNVPKPEAGEPDLRLIHMAPLPLKTVTSTKRWAEGYRPRRNEEYADARF